MKALEDIGEEKQMCEYIDRLEARGEARGEERTNKLFDFLFRDNRLEDARKATVDAEKRKQLYEEYHI